MNENENVNVQAQAVNDTNSDKDYVDAIERLQKNSVSKEEYEKVLKDRKTLIDRLANGQYDEQPKVDAPKDLNKLREFLKPDSMPLNLDFAKSTLELRNELLKRGEDIFLPVGEGVNITDEDVRTANKVAEALQYCVDQADGNADVFNNTLIRIIR